MFPVSESVFHWYDLGATFFWAMSGAILAARKGGDIVGIFIIAMVSATGGGLLRDGLFLPGWQAPKLIQTPDYLVTVAIAAAIVVLCGRWLREFRWLPRALTLADALGIGAYGVVGMHAAILAGIPTIGAILVGVVNAVGGGAMRDLLLGQKIQLLQPSVWMGLASVMGCILFAVLLKLDVVAPWAGAAAAFAAFAIRLLALRFNLRSRALRAFEQDWRSNTDPG